MKIYRSFALYSNYSLNFFDEKGEESLFAFNFYFLLIISDASQGKELHHELTVHSHKSLLSGQCLNLHLLLVVNHVLMQPRSHHHRTSLHHHLLLLLQLALGNVQLGLLHHLILRNHYQFHDRQ